MFDARQFGARGDGRTLDTRAVQSAIDAAAAAGGGAVVLSKGEYLAGSLWLKSGVELRIEPEATLLGSTSRRDYQRNRWYALLLAEGQKNITVTGGGTIDGQGRELARDVVRRVASGEIDGKQRRPDRPDETERPLLIEFRNCRGVSVGGVTLRDSSCWVQNYLGCEDLTIDRIKVRSTAFWNNDGIDISDCSQVRVSRCDIDAADDGICLKSDRGGHGCYDVDIADCRIRSSASALKFGTASFGGFRKIRVRNLSVYDTFRSAIALESVDGGILDDVIIEHVRATNTGNAVFLRLGHRASDAAVGRLSNVVIRDLKVQVPAGKPDAGYETEGPPAKAPHNVFPASLAGLPGFPVSHVALEDVEIIYRGGAQHLATEIPLAALDRIPEQAERYPEFSMFGELPAWGFYLRHVEAVRFRNVRIVSKGADFRAAMVLDDVKGGKFDHLMIESADSNPVIALRGGKQVAFDGFCADASGRLLLGEGRTMNLVRLKTEAKE